MFGGYHFTEHYMGAIHFTLVVTLHPFSGGNNIMWMMLCSWRMDLDICAMLFADESMILFGRVGGKAFLMFHMK